MNKVSLEGAAQVLTILVVYGDGETRLRIWATSSRHTISICNQICNVYIRILII